MYNRVRFSQKKNLILKSCTTGVDSSFTEKIVNELHYWMDNHRLVIPYTNISNTIYVK